MSDLLIRHMLGQSAVVLRKADSRPFLGRELGEQVMEEIPIEPKREKSALLPPLFLALVRRGKGRENSANSSINS